MGLGDWIYRMRTGSRDHSRPRAPLDHSLSARISDSLCDFFGRFGHFEVKCVSGFTRPLRHRNYRSEVYSPKTSRQSVTRRFGRLEAPLARGADDELRTYSHKASRLRQTGERDIEATRPRGRKSKTPRVRSAPIVSPTFRPTIGGASTLQAAPPPPAHNSTVPAPPPPTVTAPATTVMAPPPVPPPFAPAIVMEGNPPPPPQPVVAAGFAGPLHQGLPEATSQDMRHLRKYGVPETHDDENEGRHKVERGRPENRFPTRLQGSSKSESLTPVREPRHHQYGMYSESGRYAHSAPPAARFAGRIPPLSRSAEVPGRTFGSLSELEDTDQDIVRRGMLRRTRRRHVPAPQAEPPYSSRRYSHYPPPRRDLRDPRYVQDAFLNSSRVVQPRYERHGYHYDPLA